MYKCPNQFREWPDEVLYNCLIDMCVRFNDIPQAIKLFQSMTTKPGPVSTAYKRHKHFNPPTVRASAVTFGILIKAYGQANQLDQAFMMFRHMKFAQLVPSSMTYGCLLQACVKNNDIKRAVEVFDNMKADKIQMNTVIYTTMIKAY